MRKKKEMVRCWDFFLCKEKECPAYKAKDLKCWLFSGTHCRDEIQGKFLEKMELCLNCEVFNVNMDVPAMRATLDIVNRQLGEFREIVEARDRELESMSMELAIGLSEVFEALKKISQGDPTVRISEDSNIELISKLKHVVNLTAEEIAEVVNMLHEIAIVLAEHFDVLNRVSKGCLSARVYGSSNIEMLESLKEVTNKMIESISQEINERKQVEEELQKAKDELESRVRKRTEQLTLANERLQQEIAERKRIEEALRKSEQKYKAVFESTGNPTLIIESDDIISMVNTKFEKLSGYSKEEIEGKKKWIEFFNRSERDKLTHYCNMRKIESKTAPIDYEAQLIDREGRVRDIILNISKISGSRKCVVSIVDVTERKQLEEKMYQTDKLVSIGTLAAGVAHEINNPLAIILGFTDLLLEKKYSDPKIYDMLSTIQKQGNNAKRIVENLLSFVRFREHREEDVNINKCIDDVLIIEQNTFLINNIKVERELAESLPLVKGDASELQQVFLNIINNAVFSMRGGGILKISTRTLNGNQNVEIRISDTGIGIKPEHRKRVFDPLFTTKKVGEGTGLGLTVSYAIIKKHGGNITFETKTKEESTETGTTFIITLPSIDYKKTNDFYNSWISTKK